MSLFNKGVLSFIIVSLLAAACLVAPAYFIYKNARGLVTGQVSKNAIDIAVSVAAFVEKDIDLFEDSPVYVYAPENGGLQPDNGVAPRVTPRGFRLRRYNRKRGRRHEQQRGRYANV